jgi:predicted MFS family arabinose efflux permease
MSVMLEGRITKDIESTAVHEPATTLRWYVLALLVLVAACSAVDRNLLPILSEPIKRELGLSDGQFGLLAGAIYAVSFSIVGLPLGFLIDRVHRVRLLAVLVAIWSFLTAASGLAPSYLMLALARAGVAGAESGAPAISMSLLTDYFPAKQRGTALGWYYASSPIGLALGFALGGLIAAHLDWRAAFFVVGTPGLILAILCLLTVPEPVRGTLDKQTIEPSERSTLHSLLALIWRRKALLFLILGGIAVIIAWSGIVSFLGAYLIRVQHLPIGYAGVAIAVTLGTTGVIGMPLGGIIADRLAQRSEARALVFTALMLFVTTLCVAAAFFAPDLTLCLTLIGVVSALTSLFYGPCFRTYLNNSPASVRGATGALLIVAMNLVGYGVGPTVAGLLSDVLRSHDVGQPLRLALVTMGGFYSLGAIALLAASYSLATSRTEDRDD